MKIYDLFVPYEARQTFRVLANSEPAAREKVLLYIKNHLTTPRSPFCGETVKMIGVDDFLYNTESHRWEVAEFKLDRSQTGGKLKNDRV